MAYSIIDYSKKQKNPPGKGGEETREATDYRWDVPTYGVKATNALSHKQDIKIRKTGQVF